MKPVRKAHFREGEGTPHSTFGLPPQAEIDAQVDVLVSRSMPWLLAAPTGLMAPEARRRSTRSGTRKRILAGSAAAAIIISGASTMAVASGGTKDLAAALSEASAPAAPRVAPVPSGATERLLPTPDDAPESAAYQLVAIAGVSQPVIAYDPCRPIHYVVAEGGAPEGAEQMLNRAFDRLSAATGLVFVGDGATDEAPSEDRAVYQPERYGESWAPILVSWGGEGLPGDSLGMGESRAISLGDSPYVLVSGQLVFNGPLLGEWLSGPDGAAFVDAVVLREAARLLGLREVDDPAQLMHQEVGLGALDLGDGDLAGLAVLGSGVCAPEL